MIYYCRTCERIVAPQEVQSINTKDNPHNAHRSKIVGVEDETLKLEIRRVISNLDRQGRLFELK